jgi:glycosyltransferase involved in cell wall biosynthesis
MITQMGMGRKIALAFVGSIVPEGAEFRNAAFSPAGQMYQSNLLSGLNRCGLERIEIFSCLPIPAFPSGKRFWVRGGRAELNGLPLHLVSFINVLLLKQFMIGMAVCIRLLLWAWRNRAYDRVVLTYNLTVPPGLFTLLAAKSSKTKAVAALCDVHVPGAVVPRNIFTIVDFWFHKRLTPYFDGFIVASDAIAQDFCAGRPTIRIEGGLSELAIEYFRSHSRRTKARDGSNFGIAVASKLDEVNGITILLHALEKLPPHIHLYVAGAGPLAEEVRKRARQDGRLHFLGLLSFQQVLELYRSVDLLVNLRATQAIDTRYFFPSKFTEYVGAGTPVLSSKTGHIEAEYSEFVYLLENESSECLVAAIQRIASIPAPVRERMAEAGQAYVLREKTWDRQASRAMDLILQCLGKTQDSTHPLLTENS